MKSIKRAFHWIIDILKKRRVPFQISGGLAARIYGATRKLADIDIDIQNKHFKKLLPEVKDYIIFGPRRYKNKNWDLYLMTLCYRGQKIDICGADNAKIFDKNRGVWILYRTDFSMSESKKIFGIKVSVISKNDLINYKRKLRRRVDLLDLKQID